MRYHRPPEMWLEVRDNDYYTQQLRQLSYFRNLLYPDTGAFDKIIRELYLQPIIEQLNKPPPWLIELDPLPLPAPPKRRLRFGFSTSRPSPEGKLAFELGVKVGYWPCLKGPFIAIALGFRRLDIWYGLPSYWHNGKAPE